MKLYHAGYKNLDFVTSPTQMVTRNKRLAKFVAWHDDDSGNTWKKWLHTLMGGNFCFLDINAVVLEDLIDNLLLWYVVEPNLSNYFVKFGILRTEKAGRQVSK